jgi:hypothetical protein
MASRRWTDPAVIRRLACMTDHPTSAWVAQQVVEAFADREAPRYLIRDRDGAYGKEFRRRLKSLYSKGI